MRYDMLTEATMRGRTSWAAVILTLTACNSGGGEGKSIFTAGKAVTTATDAAAQTAQSHQDCIAAQPFYWEIGDAKGALASGQAGGEDYTADSSMLIASASKWLFGAYVLERYQGALTPVTADALRMHSGYIGFKNLRCRSSDTVNECFIASQTTLATDEIGKFHYDGGHFQKWMVDNGLGAMTDADLTAEYERYLGSDLGLLFSTPSPAGGMRGTPKAYAAFLRKLMNGNLVLGAHLGENAVCTRPGVCPNAVYSPAPADWHYSYGHWVEDDDKGDGAFSSPGLFGFYPWISADKKHYGLVARMSTSLGAYVASAYCGQAIRKAYFSVH